MVSTHPEVSPNMITNLSAWLAAIVPSACWLTYRVLVLRQLSRALDSSPEHARVMASAIKAAR